MRNGGKWTEARYRSFVTSTLRAGSRKWPPKYETLNAAKTEKKVNKATGRLAQHYLCAMCEQEYTQKDVQVDHIKPVIDPKKGFVSWDTYIDRMFCEGKNLQVLCKVCHAEKTKLEKEISKKHASK
ncbi:HNHc domain containing protein [uncultured Caudovirales phage]|uniref:HNHc domain containing protein n=1 Tax=uncultured Caudovirales phage TaxID=2100421 RepID=A0A6J5LD45_9CAUD|nr:HNHc domain containing protein [uncultured Caudovirales phage]